MDHRVLVEPMIITAPLDILNILYVQKELN
jgi:hypothetical protein